ncbi:MAG: amidohydrolase [Rhodospirillaceae bacterium]|nr:amidohydrolase [Rhodospirillaceae bacterium]
MKIDVFNHVFPTEFFEAAEKLMPARSVKRWKAMEELYDMDARMKVIDKFDNYQQIISISQPPLDMIAGPEDSPELARVANDGMARICREYSDRMPWFIAALPMNNTQEAISEVDRVLDEHGAVGFQIHSNVNGKPLDSSEFRDIFAKIAERGKCVWLHPTRPASHADYLTEDQSHYEIFWGVGWAYETTAAMCRMVCSGMFDEIPNFHVMAHHWGAYIPHAEGRMPLWESRNATSSADGTSFADELEKPMLDYFKMFYGDTAMFGAKAQSQAGLDFFGSGNSFFATDAPYDLSGGEDNIRDTIDVIESLNCTEEDRQVIYERNTRELILGG